jgi:hypothetical protein
MSDIARGGELSAGLEIEPTVAEEFSAAVRAVREARAQLNRVSGVISSTSAEISHAIKHRKEHGKYGEGALDVSDLNKLHDVPPPTQEIWGLMTSRGAAQYEESVRSAHLNAITGHWQNQLTSRIQGEGLLVKLTSTGSSGYDIALAEKTEAQQSVQVDGQVFKGEPYAAYYTIDNPGDNPETLVGMLEELNLTDGTMLVSDPATGKRYYVGRMVLPDDEPDGRGGTRVEFVDSSTILPFLLEQLEQHDLADAAEVA